MCVSSFNRVPTKWRISEWFQIIPEARPGPSHLASHLDWDYFPSGSANFLKHPFNGMSTHNQNNRDQGWSPLPCSPQAKSSASMAEMSAYVFPVNNITQLDAILDHSLNKDRSHWEAEGGLASSRSMDRTAQRQADMSFQQWRLTLAWGEAAGWSARGQVVMVGVGGLGCREYLLPWLVNLHITKNIQMTKQEVMYQAPAIHNCHNRTVFHLWVCLFWLSIHLSIIFSMNQLIVCWK